MYIWGDVGRGKSMILDLFFSSIPFDEKLKIHFHKFILDFHKKLNALRANSKGKSSDYITQIAKELSERYKVICLDELQINNIVDAMVVGRLFESLLHNGCYIFFTSNRHPSELFKDGLQRERFLPFIHLIEDKLDVFELNNYEDYRLRGLSNIQKHYYCPLGSRTSKKIDDIIFKLTGHTNNFKEVEIFSDKQKPIRLHNTYGTLAVFSFKELCEVPLGAIDYMAICKHFNTIIVKNIPKLNKDNHNEVLRFITFIDCVYETKTTLICSAAAEPEKLYNSGKNAFEFKRTISRLNEISSTKYLAKI